MINKRILIVLDNMKKYNRKHTSAIKSSYEVGQEWGNIIKAKYPNITSLLISDLAIFIRTNTIPSDTDIFTAYFNHYEKTTNHAT